MEGRYEQETNKRGGQNTGWMKSIRAPHRMTSVSPHLLHQGSCGSHVATLLKLPESVGSWFSDSHYHNMCSSDEDDGTGMCMQRGCCLVLSTAEKMSYMGVNAVRSVELEYFYSSPHKATGLVHAD